MVQIAKETQKMTDGQINNYISRNYSINWWNCHGY